MKEITTAVLRMDWDVADKSGHRENAGRPLGATAERWWWAGVDRSRLMAVRGTIPLAAESRERKDLEIKDALMTMYISHLMVSPPPAPKTLNVK